MAIVLFGPLVSEVRGSIGGTVFTRTRAGAIAKKKTKPVFRPTNVRLLWQQAMATVYGRWRDTLTVPQRAAWNTLGDSTVWQNALGEDYSPSGLNLYLRTNTLTYKMNMSFIDVAPANATATHHPVVWTWTGTDQVKATADAGLPEPWYNFVWVTSGLLPTINYNRGPYRFHKEYLAFTIKAGANVTAVGEVLQGARVFCMDRQIADDGSITDKYYFTLDCVD